MTVILCFCVNNVSFSCNEILPTVQACSAFVEIVQNQGRQWHRMLRNEHEHRLRLEELVEQLGHQHSSLERQVRKSLSSILNFSTPHIDTHVPRQL